MVALKFSYGSVINFFFNFSNKIIFQNCWIFKKFKIFWKMQIFWKINFFWKIQKDSIMHFLNFSKILNSSEFLNFSKFFKISKKVDDGPIADQKCNHWRRDSITNITSDVVAFCQLSSIQSSTSFEIFKNFETFNNLKT